MKESNSLLVVEDDENLLELLKNGFLLKGYQCETAKSGESALELIKNTPFDFLIADIILPGIGGFELTEKAKRMRPDMAVIIMTGFIDDFSYDKALEAGASDFIKKPFTIKELIARVKHVKLQEKLRELSITDELTGLFNRRGFFPLVEQQLKLSNRQKRGIFMLCADLDELKKINDTFGHHEGDLALKETADILKESFREADIIARIGGDEFIVIPVGTTEASVEKITARLHEVLEIHNAERRGSYKLSISVGVAFYNPDSPCSIDELLSRADKLMYDQKRLKLKS
jgi:diguanylate cyclase (GGDEF)-like protein